MVIFRRLSPPVSPNELTPLTVTDTCSGRGPPTGPWNERLGYHTRSFCYSTPGFITQVGINVFMMMLNLFLIIYEAIELSPFSTNPLKTPVWFICCDLIILLVLLFEVLARLVEYNCNWSRYIDHFSNRVDIAILIFSVAACLVYFFEDNVTTQAGSNFTFLMVRIFRDVTRMLRCVWFLSQVYSSLAKGGLKWLGTEFPPSYDQLVALSENSIFSEVSHESFVNHFTDFTKEFDG